MKKILIIQFLCLAVTYLSAQNATISGYISDSDGEVLIGANIYETISKQGTITNAYGFYSLTLPIGQSKITFSYVGYQTKSIALDLQNDTTIQVNLTVQDITEVVISAQKRPNTEQIGIVNLPIEQIKLIPTIGGEADIIKALSFTPGVSNGSEGSSGLYVRGGTPDQNLILLDDAVVYNPNHLFGFLSVFNTDAIKDVSLIKGGFPARYGGRLSSVLDIKMKEGNFKKIKGDIGVGLLASRVTLEGPIIKDKLSFIVSARSSYLNLLTFPFKSQYNSGDLEEFLGYTMHDINTKLNWKINDKNQVFASFYTGNDDFKSYAQDYPNSEDIAHLNWGNTTATLRWNSQLSPKLFWKNMFIYSKFNYDLNISSKTFPFIPDSLRNGTIQIVPTVTNIGNFSGLQDLTFKSAIDFLPNPNHTLRFGIEATRHWFTPQISSFTDKDTTLLGVSKNVRADELAFYAEDEWRVFEKLKVNFGVRYNNFFLKNKTYYSLEPRISFSYELPQKVYLKAAYTQMQQNIHLLTNNGIGFQNDIWVPSTENIAPQRSKQWALAVSKYIEKWQTEFSIETYYKKMTNLISYQEGINPFLNLDQEWLDIIEVNGVGLSYGLELFAHKKIGKWNGLMSYTLSKTNQQFENINLGKVYPFKYDFRNNIAMTGSYQLSQNWTISASWVYRSGQPTNLPIAVHNPNNSIDDVSGNVFIYGERNSIRLPSYHRLDLGANYTKTNDKGNQHTWNFSVYNAYYRKNTLYAQVANEAKIDLQTGAFLGYNQTLVLRTLFPILPSISYSFSF
jgi:outer membrane receptor for ferrienterochelin and colicin